jgi:6-phosphogluconolactonase (cycloisomerase 2 family)
MAIPSAARDLLLDSSGTPTYVSQTTRVIGGTTSIAVVPSAKFAYTGNVNANTVTAYSVDYVVNQSSDNLSLFAINSTTATLASQGTIATGANSTSIVLTQ